MNDREEHESNIALRTLIEKIRLLCLRYHNPSVTTGVHILASKIVRLIEGDDPHSEGDNKNA